MRAVVQRVSRASVRVQGRTIGEVGRGLLVLLGVSTTDGDDAIEWMAEKLAGLRIFPDDEGRMNRSVTDAGGAILVVSQFTLYGDARKGRRPSFVEAAPPDVAEPVYERVVTALRELGIDVATGAFGAMMEVELVNDGPVTIWLER